MDPLSSLLDSINQAASSRSPSAQDVLAHASTTIAPSEQVASQRATSAQSELAAPESAMSTPAENGATDMVDIEVGGDDSPLSSASPEAIRLPRWDDLSPLGDRSDNLNMYARVCGCMNELKIVHEVRSTEVCEFSPTKGKPAKTRLGKAQENLETIHRGY